MRAELERSASALGVADRVRFDGPLTHCELPDAYASADVVVVPSVEDASGDRDGLPNVVLEAMAAGRPVVASEIAAIGTAVRDGETGLLCRAGDAPTLRAAIERVARDRALAQRMGRAARALVEREFELGHAPTVSWLASRTPMREHAPTTARRSGSVAYVLKGFPRLSETFIPSEIHRVEQAGVPLRLFAIKPVEERSRDRAIPVVDAIRAQPDYLPDGRPALGVALHHWRPRRPPPFLARCRAACAAPAGGAGARGGGRRPSRARAAAPLSPPAQDLHQGAAAGDRARRPPARRARRPPPARPLRARHDDGHLARGADHRPAVLLHRPRARHLREELNPNGWLRRKLLAARFVVTCTEANVRHLQRDRARGRVHLVYHGLSADLHRPPRGRRGPPERNGHLRVLGVGRLVAKKGFDMLVDACAVLRDRGVPFEARDRRPGGPHGRALLRRRIAALGARGRSCTCPAPMGRRTCCASTAAPTRCACPAGCSPDDRDGIPNVLVEAMAAGAPVVATACPASPSSSRRGQRPARRARRPGRSPTRCSGCTTTPRSPRDSARGRARDRARALRRRAAGAAASADAASGRPR